MRHGEQNNSIFFDEKCSAFIFSSTVALRCTHTAAFGENNKNGTSWFRVPKREHRNSNTRVPKDEYRVKCLMNMGNSISALFFRGFCFGTQTQTKMERHSLGNTLTLEILCNFRKQINHQCSKSFVVLVRKFYFKH